MKRSDIILIIVLVVISGLSLIGITVYQNNVDVEEVKAVVYYNDEKIMEIYLDDGDYKVFNETRVLNIDEDNNVFHVLGSNPYGVFIEYKDQKVGVIDEESPKNICQYQGFTNSSLSPITCLPNQIVIVVESNDDVDTIAY